MIVARSGGISSNTTRKMKEAVSLRGWQSPSQVELYASCSSHPSTNIGARFQGRWE